MSPDLQKELQQLSAKAKQHLKDVPASGSYRHVFSFWTLPSFSPSSRWTVYSPVRVAHGHQPFASCSVWRSDVDLEKFRSPVERLRYPKDLTPTIDEETVSLTGEVIAEFEQTIQQISIPFFLGSPSVAGCDGTRFEFYYDQLFFGGSLHWWENHPAEWRPFTEAVMRIAANLEARKGRRGVQEKAI